jgi:hypothetical protein
MFSEAPMQGSAAKTASVRGRPRSLALASLVVAVPLWSACSSGGGAAPAALCQKITDDLANGPDSGADPVGYALSQIRPLAQIHSTDQSVAAALTKLIAADHALVNSDGHDHAASTSIAKADAALNLACPGASS